MWILVPRGATTPGELLDPKLLAAVGSHLSEPEIDLSLPRWDFGTTIPLMPELRKIGLTDLSNFRGISDSGLSLSDAIHRANITVDEQGTEAGAVTGTAFIAVCRRCGPPAVRADHPFAFAIVDRPTKTPLFIGHFADPTEAASTQN